MSEEIQKKPRRTASGAKSSALRPRAPRKTVQSPASSPKGKAHLVSAVKHTASAVSRPRESEGAPSRGDVTYASAVGRRKESVARVRLYLNRPGDIVVNEKPLKDYFRFFEYAQMARSPLEAVGADQKMSVVALASGGGARSQAEAVRLAIARALVKHDENLKKTLRPMGYLTRDSRAKERKKPGLKRARRAPQFAKR